MNRRQRLWVSGSLLVLGLTLANAALEWDMRTVKPPTWRDGPRDIEVFVLAEEPMPAIEKLPDKALVRIAQGEPGSVGEWVRRGLYVRREWGESALVWGGLLPLALFSGAGFIALGARASRP